MNSDKQIEEMRHLADEMGKAISNEYERRVLADERKLEAVLKENGWRKASEVAFEMVDKFRDAIINTFLAMCSYNDYNKINLLQICDAVDSIYDDLIGKIKEQYNG